MPYRTCIVCGAVRPKGELLRFVYDGGLAWDMENKRGGRGYYVCSSCTAGFANPKLLRKTLRMNIDAEEISLFLQKIDDNS